MTDFLQHRVSTGMTEGIIDALESVEIHEEDRKIFLGADRRGERVIGVRLEECPVREAGQGVMQGQVMGLLFGKLPRTDVYTVPWTSCGAWSRSRTA